MLEKEHQRAEHAVQPPPAERESPAEREAKQNRWRTAFHWFGAESRAHFINDEQFINDLKQLKELRSFLIREAVKLSAADPNSITFKGLNGLRYSPLGRTPTEGEWAQVEKLTQSLFGLLPEPLRQKFVLGRIPSWVTWLPIAFALVAIISLMYAVDVALDIIRASDVTTAVARMGGAVISYYLVWLASLGAIGAVAFIGMNALSVQDDATFDLMNTRLMFLRIALGALFGLVLTLPFGFEDFLKFLAYIIHRTDDKPDVMRQATMLLLPFILGFSTSLVILVLNRFVEAVQGFFGRPTERGAATRPKTGNRKSGRQRAQSVPTQGAGP